MKSLVVLVSWALTIHLPAPVAAEVTERTPAGFTVRHVVEVAVPPDALYAAITRHVGEWWDPAHTYSGDARNLSIVHAPGGCFCEALPGGGGVEHARVVQVQPNALIRMRGSLGPLQEAGVAATMTWQVERAGQGARLTLTHLAGGYYPGGLDTLAPAIDRVLGEQVARLKAYAEAQGR